MATRKDKIDFIYNVAKYNGLKNYTKTNLNKMPEEFLDEFINQSDEVKEKFALYLSHVESAKKPKSVRKAPQKKKMEVFEASDEKIELLNEVAGNLAKNPTSLLAILEFKECLGELKYGEVPEIDLMRNIDILKEASAPQWALKLLKFSVDQALAMQEK